MPKSNDKKRFYTLTKHTNTPAGGGNKKSFEILDQFKIREKSSINALSLNFFYTRGCPAELNLRSKHLSWIVTLRGTHYSIITQSIKIC